MKKFNRWFWIDTPFGFLLCFFLFMSGVTWVAATAPWEHYQETTYYSSLERWHETHSELKSDIEQAWADGFVSKKEYDTIRDKWFSLDELKDRDSFINHMAHKKKAWEDGSEDGSDTENTN